MMRTTGPLARDLMVAGYLLGRERREQYGDSDRVCRVETL